jgi:hypothetical protein
MSIIDYESSLPKKKVRLVTVDYRRLLCMTDPVLYNNNNQVKPGTAITSLDDKDFVENITPFQTCNYVDSEVEAESL